jgi:hypothetical protein
VGAYSLGAGIAGTLFRWLDLVAIHRPEQDFWRLEDGKKIDSAPKGALKKLRWFFLLWISQRYFSPSNQSNFGC